MDISNNQTYNLLKNAVKVSTTRGKVIANNMANINTKGFKKSYVSFEENYRDAKDSLQLKTTKNNHIKDNKNPGDISIKQDKSTSMRADGNNVDLDLEKVNQASNTLMYNALITKVNGKFSSMQSIISGGGR